VTAEASRGDEIVLKVVKATKPSNAALTGRLVDDVDAVATAMATRDALRLTIKANTHGTETELTDETLAAGRGGHAHRCRALNAAVASTVRNKTRGLEREHLIRRELLLVEGLLLTLKRFNLILYGDLCALSAFQLGQDTG
jgi:hypothetical protein